MKTLKWIILILIPMILFSLSIYIGMLKTQISHENKMISDISSFSEKSLELLTHRIDEMDYLNKDTAEIPNMTIENLEILKEKYNQLYSDYFNYIEILDNDFIDKVNRIDKIYYSIHSVSMAISLVIFLTIIELILIAFTIKLKKNAQL